MSNSINYNVLIADLCAKSLAGSREAARISRRKLSEELDISESTIKCWETGQGSPNLKAIMDWFRITDANPFLAMLGFFWYEDFGSLRYDSTVDELRKALCTYYTKIANAEELRKMDYILFGDHGSDWSGILDMACAHLHTSMESRIKVAEIIQISYEMSANLSSAYIHKDVSDNTKLLCEAIDAAILSLKEGKSTYTIKISSEDYDRAISQMLKKSREDAGLEQSDMAKAMGKTGKTIKHWETTGQLAFLDLCRWFNCTDKSFWTYMREAFGLTNVFEYTSKDKAIAKKLVDYVNNKATDEEIKKFAFIDFGNHGSSWISILELMYEYVCTPLRERVITSRSVLVAYQSDNSTNKITGARHILPDIENLERCIKEATEEAKAEVLKAQFKKNLI